MVAKLRVMELTPGRRTDELVATKVMGWKIALPEDDREAHYRLEDADGKVVASWDAPPEFYHELHSAHRWSPSTTWDATGRVMEMLRIALGPAGVLGWVATCQGLDEYGLTPHLAVCRIALRLVGEVL